MAHNTTNNRRAWGQIRRLPEAPSAPPPSTPSESLHSVRHRGAQIEEVRQLRVSSRRSYGRAEADGSPDRRPVGDDQR